MKLGTYLKLLSEYDLKLVLKDTKALVNRLYTDEIPSMCTFPWITSSPGLWLNPPGPLGDIQKELWGIVQGIHCDDALKIEKQYKAKWRPRNVKLGEAVRDMVQSLKKDLRVPEPNWRGQHFQFNLESVVKILERVVHKSSGTSKPLSRIVPAKAQAIIGLTIDPTDGHVYHGHKGDCWYSVLETAKRTAVKAMQDSRLRWDMPIEEVRRVLRDYYLAYILLLRIDSKPLDPRAIFAGNSWMLALEQWQLSALMDDMKKCQYFAYHPTRTKHRIADMILDGENSFLQGDLEHWDRSICSYFILTVWRAISQVYKLDERIMCLCAYYNAYAPLILPASDGTPKIFMKDGVVPSGSGGFVPVNNILNFVFQLLTTMNLLWEKKGGTFEECLEEALRLAGQVFGDDFFWSGRFGEDVWAERLLSAFGIVMKKSATLVSKRVVVMVSRIHDIQTGVVHPIIMRRGRNALCPKHDGAESGTHADYKIAQSYRAQSYEIEQNARQGIPGYKRLWDFWRIEVCPRSRVMETISDHDLAVACQKLHISHDALTWVIRLTPP